MSTPKKEYVTISREQLNAYWDQIPMFSDLETHERQQAVLNALDYLEDLRTSLSSNLVGEYL